MIKFLTRDRNNLADSSRLPAGSMLGLVAVAFGLCGIVATSAARAATETPIYDFHLREDGGFPAGVIRDPAAENAGIVPAGTLFGTATFGGEHANAHGEGGTVFMLTPPATSGGAWALKVLHQFDPRPASRDGFYPTAELTADSAGNMYGTTMLAAGYRGGGTVFELSPPTASDGDWAYQVLHRFRRTSQPSGRLTLDPSGSGVLYGATSQGGSAPCQCGVVFSLTPPGVNGNATSGWTVRWLYEFRGGYYGARAQGAMVFDNSSPPNLFGTTDLGGPFNVGVVFELLPPNSNDNPLSHWIEKLIHTFKGAPTDGAGPNGLTIDSNGVLYGTTYAGGRGSGSDFGTVFEILPPSLSTTGAWERVILHSFRGTGTPVDDGKNPTAGLLLDSGKLYGTTFYGGTAPSHPFLHNGTVFELTPTANPRIWKETGLARFRKPADGQYPGSELTFGADGNLYGTTSGGGLPNRGTVFEVTVP